MILDAHNLFSDAQALTAAAASTNLIDLGVAREIGNGRQLSIFLNVDVALTDASSDSTVTVTLETDDNEAFSSATSAATMFTIAATAAAGTTYSYKIPDSLSLERYIRVYYTMNNGNLSTGTVTCGIVMDRQAQKIYADGFTIS